MENNNPNIDPQVPSNEPAPAPEAQPQSSAEQQVPPQQQMPPQQQVPPQQQMPLQQQMSPQQVPPVYQVPVPTAGNNNMPVIALVCGILGLVGAWIPVVSYFTWVLSILGIVFGVKGRKTAPEGKTGMATAGMVLGIVSLALDVVAIICAVCVLAGFAGLGYSLY